MERLLPRRNLYTSTKMVLGMANWTQNCTKSLKNTDSIHKQGSIDLFRRAGTRRWAAMNFDSSRCNIWLSSFLGPKPSLPGLPSTQLISSAAGTRRGAGIDFDSSRCIDFVSSRCKIWLSSCPGPKPPRTAFIECI